MKRLSDEEIQKALYKTDSRSVAKRITTQDKERFEAVAEAQMKADAQENENALRDYTEGKISFEKLAKRLGVNFYAIVGAFYVRVKELVGG